MEVVTDGEGLGGGGEDERPEEKGHGRQKVMVVNWQNWCSEIDCLGYRVSGDGGRVLGGEDACGGVSKGMRKPPKRRFDEQQRGRLCIDPWATERSKPLIKSHCSVCIHRA